MSHAYLKVSTAALSAALLSLYSGAADAQAEQGGAPVSPAKPDPQAASSTIADIVVTAQKRSERAQDVPIAISVLTTATLQATGVSGTSDLGRAVPGLTFPATASIAQPFLRGVGTSSIAPGDENNVAIYVDGVYISAPTGSIFSLNNIAQIEVLKGPQSTLFGRNATGGVIQLVTSDPTQHPTANFNVGYANYKTVESSFYGSTGIAPGLAADIALFYHDQEDGWGKNLDNGEDVFKEYEFSARSKIVYDAGGSTKVKLGLDYDTNRNDLNAAFQVAPGQRALFAPNLPYPGFYNVDLDSTPYNKTKSYGVSLTIDHDLGFANLVSISAYRHNTTLNIVDQDGSPVPITTIFADEADRTYTQELQLKSHAGSIIQWVGGLYYFDDKVTVNHFDQIDGFAQGAADGVIQTRNGYQGTRSYAAFAQATVPLGARTNLTLGGRYTIDDRRILIDVATFNPASGLTQDPGSPAAGSKSFGKPTWRISLDHRFSNDVLAYASYNRGFKSGLYNFQSPFEAGATIDDSAHLQAVRPSILDAYEVGVKTDLLDRHVRLNVSGFYYDYKDIQINQFIQGGSLLLNAASADIKGIDADLTVRPFSHFQVNLAGSYLDATFQDFLNLPTLVDNPPSIGGTQNASIPNGRGYRLPQAPKFTGNASASYDMPTAVGDFALTGSVSYNDGFFWSPDDLIRTNAYTLVNASLVWTSSDGRLNVRAWGKNILDKKYYGFQGEGAPFPARTSPAAPATYGVTLGVRFQ